MRVSEIQNAQRTGIRFRPVLQKIVILSECSFLTRQVETYLDAFSAKLFHVNSIAAAIEKCREFKIDVLLVDSFFVEPFQEKISCVSSFENPRPLFLRVETQVSAVSKLPSSFESFSWDGTLYSPFSKELLVQYLNKFVILLPKEPALCVDRLLERVPKILIVDDNIQNVNTLSEFFQAKGYRVLQAHNGYEAFKFAIASKPDVILMDLQMPWMDGIESTRRMRSHPLLSSVPIIALTSLARPEDREKCYDAGVSDYMVKPVSLRFLAENVKRIVVAKFG